MNQFEKFDLNATNLHVLISYNCELEYLPNVVPVIKIKVIYEVDLNKNIHTDIN